MKNMTVQAMFLMLVVSAPWASARAAEVEAEGPMATVQLGRLLRDSNADLPVYSCDLRKQFSQCRQYAVYPGNAAARVTELTDACHSLGGTLLLTPCPDVQVLAQCHEVKFRRDVVYDAVYYKGKPARWTVKKLQDVCQNLPGQFAMPAPRQSAAPR